MRTPVNHRGSPHISTGDIMLVQESMRVAGLYAGEIDGIANSATLAAVRRYKKQHQMAPNNALTTAFVTHLREAL